MPRWHMALPRWWCPGGASPVVLARWPVPRWHRALPAASAHEVPYPPTHIALDTQTGVGSSYIGRGEGEIGAFPSVMHDAEVPEP